MRNLNESGFKSLKNESVIVPEEMNGYLVLGSSDSNNSSRNVNILKFVLESGVGTTLNGLELLNTGSKAATFVSVQWFDSDTHLLELRHFGMFKNVRIGVLNERGESFELKSFLSIKRNNTVILKLNFSRKTLSIICQDDVQKRSLYFKGGQFRVRITLLEIGNFILVSPFAVDQYKSTIIQKNLENNLINQLQNLKEWTFYENSQVQIDEMLQNRIRLENDLPFVIKSFIHDPELRVTAIRRNEIEQSHLLPFKNSRIVTVTELSEIVFAESGKKEPSLLEKFYFKNRETLLSQGESLTKAELLGSIQRFIAALKHVPHLKKESNSNFTSVYIESKDCLILSNRVNKIKMIYERDENGEFIISPYVFETSQVSIQLDLGDLKGFFYQIDWEMLIDSSTALENRHLFNALSSIRKSLVAIGLKAFFTCPNSLFEELVQFVSKQFASVKNLGGCEERRVLGADSHFENLKGVELSCEDGLGDIFEENFSRKTRNSSQIDGKEPQFFSTREYTSKDKAKGVLLRFEEALFQQCGIYHERVKSTTRQHTSLYRLASFVNSSIEKTLLKKTLDLGGYFDGLANEIRFFYDETTIICSCPGKLSDEDCERIRSLNGPVINRECVPLSFSLNHLRPEVFESGIAKLDLVVEDQFVAVVDKNFTFKLYSFEFGLTLLFNLELSEEVVPIALPDFSSFLQSSREGLNYFSTEECNRYQPVVEKPEPTLEEPKDESKINQKSLEQLYKMGFNINICKKALSVAKNGELDSAVNFIIQNNLNSPKIEGERTPKTRILKPFWECEMCTLINDHSKTTERADLCQACGNQAGPNSYLPDKTVEPGDDSRAVKIEKPTRLDEVKLTLGFQSKGKNRLNSFIFIIFFKTQKKENKAMCLRLAYSPFIIKSSLIVDGMGECPTSTWFGKSILHRGLEEDTLGGFFQNEFFLQVNSILQLISEEPLLVVSKLEMLILKPDCDVFGAVSLSSSTHNSENTFCCSLLLSLPKGLMLLEFKDQSKSYNESGWTFTFLDTIESDSPFAVFKFRDNVFVSTNGKINNFKDVTVCEGRLDSENWPSESIFTEKDGSQLKLRFESGLKCEQVERVQKRDIPETELKVDLAAGEGEMYPGSFLMRLKRKKKTKPELILLENFILNPDPDHFPDSTLVVLNKKLESRAVFGFIKKVKSIEAQLEFFVSVPKSDPFLFELMKLSKETAQTHQNKSFKKFNKLFLKPKELKGPQFSKSMQLSKVLFADSEFFSTTFISNIFSFEDVLERQMTIKKITMKINEQYLADGPISDIAVFVTGNIFHLSQLQQFKHLAKQQFMQMLAENKVKEVLKPALLINFESLKSNEAILELESPKRGKFVSFLPLRRDLSTQSNSIFSVDYFGAEGNYSEDCSESEETALETDHTKEFEDFSWLQVSVNGKNCQKNVRVKNLTELACETVVCFELQLKLQLEEQKAIELVLYNSKTEGYLHTAKTSFYICNDEWIERLKEKIDSKDYTELNEVIESYSTKIKNHTGDSFSLATYIEDFISLLIYISSTLGRSVFESIVLNLDLTDLILKTIFRHGNCSFSHVLFVFFEKIAGMEQIQSKVEDLFLEKTDSDSFLEYSINAQRLICSVAGRFLVLRRNEKLLSKIAYSLLLRALKRVNSLGAFELKLIKLLPVHSLSLRLLSQIEPIREEELFDFSSFKTADRLQFKALLVSEQNFQDYYFFLKYKCKVATVVFQLQDCETIDPFTVEISVRGRNGQFESARSKSFDSGFCSQLVRQLKQSGSAGFGIEFAAELAEFRVIRVFIKMNSLVSFRYSNTNFRGSLNFVFFGKRTAETAWDFQETFDELKNAFTSTKNERSKIEEIYDLNFESIFDFVPEVKRETQSDFESTKKDFSRVKKAIFAVASGLKIEELGQKSVVISKLEEAGKEFQTLASTVTHHQLYSENQDRDYEGNIYYWIRISSELVSIFEGTFKLDEFFYDLESEAKVELGFNLLVNLFFCFDSEIERYNDLAKRLLYFSDKMVRKSIKNRLISSILSEPEILFISNVEAFVDFLFGFDLIDGDWNALVDEILLRNLETPTEDEWKEFLIHILLVERTIHHSPKGEEREGMKEKYLVLIQFILKNELITIMPRISELLRKLIGIFVSEVFNDSGSNLDQLKELILALNSKQLLNLCISPFEKRFSKTIAAVQKTKGPGLNGQLETLRSLMRLFIQIGTESSTKGVSQIDLTFFSISKLKNVAEMIAVCESFEDPQVKEDFEGFKVEFKADVSLLLTRLFNLSTEESKILFGVISLLPVEEFSVEIFKSVTQKLFDLEPAQLQSAVEILSRNIALLFANCKLKKLLNEMGSLMIEFICKCLFNQRKLIKDNFPFIELLTQFCLLLINKGKLHKYNSDSLIIQINQSVYIPLFEAFCRVLVEDFNLGGAENFFNFQREEMPLLELMSHLSFILIKSLNEEGTAIYEVVIKQISSSEEKTVPKQLEKSMEDLIVWLMINFNFNTPSKQLVSPSGVLINRIFNECSLLFKIFFQTELICRYAMKKICVHFSKLYFALFKRNKEGKQGLMSLVLLENAVNFLELLFEELAKESRAVELFWRECDGLQFIFGIMNSIPKKEEKKTGLSAFLNKVQDFSFSSERKTCYESQVEDLSKPLCPKLFVDVANNLKMSDDDKSIILSNVKDWQANKNGFDGAVYSTFYPVNCKQIRIQFKMCSIMDIRNIKVGIYLHRTENNLAVGSPIYIKLNLVKRGGKAECEKIHIGELIRVEDKGYLPYFTEVYVLNLNRLEGKDYIDSIERLRDYFQFNEFELVFGKPVISIVDQISPINKKCSGSTNLAISFISAEGFSRSKLDVRSLFTAKIFSACSRLLSILFGSDAKIKIFDDYFDSLGSKQKKNQLSLLESQIDLCLDNFTASLDKFILVISEKNYPLCQTILRALMVRVTRNEFFFTLIDVILRVNISHEFFVDFFLYSWQKMSECSAFGGKFLEILNNYLMNALKSERDTQKSNFKLPVSLEFFNLLLQNYLSNRFNFNFERAILLLIYTLSNGSIHPVPPPNDGNALSTQMIDLLFEKVEGERFEFLHLVVYLAGRLESVDKLMQSRGIIRILIKNLEGTSECRLNFQFAVQNLLCSEKHRVELLEAGLADRLFRILEKGIGNADFENDCQYWTSVVKSIFLVYCRSRPELELLEEKLFKLLKKFKKSQFFVEKVLSEFLFMKVPKAVRFQISSRELLSLAEPQVSSLCNHASTLTPSETLRAFEGQLQICIDERLKFKLKTGSWKKLFDFEIGTPSFGEHFFQRVTEKNPLLINLVCDFKDNGQISNVFFFSPNGFQRNIDDHFYEIECENNFFFAIIEGSQVKLLNKELPGANFITLFETNDERESPSYNSYVEELQINFPLNKEMTKSAMICFSNRFEDPKLVDYFNEYMAVNSVTFYGFSLSEKSENFGNQSYETLLQGNCRSSLLSFSYSFFSEIPVFELPEELTISQLETSIKTTLAVDDKNKRLRDFQEELLTIESKRSIASIEYAGLKESLSNNSVLMAALVSRGGLGYLINLILESASLELFKTKEEMNSCLFIFKTVAKLWPIADFHFLMIQNKEFFSIIIETVKGGNLSDRDWSIAEFLICSLVVKNLSEVFSKDSSKENLEMFRKLDVVGILLDFIANLTGETKRKIEDRPESSSLITEPITPIEQTLSKDIKVRKGVGYEKEGSGKKWYLNEYLLKKKKKNELLTLVLKLFTSILEASETDSQPELFDTICSSCLLPLIENTFKNFSVIEMAQESELYSLFYELIILIANNPVLKGLLTPIPECYKPVQSQSVIEILLAQEFNIEMFKNFSGQEQNSQDQIGLSDLPNKIIETNSKIRKIYNVDHKTISPESIEDKITSGELSLNKKYRLSLESLRFGLTDMKSEGKYIHHYANSMLSDQQTTVQGRNFRLAQEIGNLMAGLPIESYNAIFVRCDMTRIDLIKALVAGAEGTPYANGLFEYHVVLPNDYPNSPPKCNLETTGSGKVRFNPNLYSCGKVCLSLLGTWRGNASENWDPNISNLLQLFLSIQSMVMSEEVYFNEPGYEREKGTEMGESKNEGYSNIVKIANIKYAIINQIENPTPGFEDVIRRHFYIKSQVILDECTAWLKMAEERKASYVELVFDHNQSFCQRFAESPTVYPSDLKKLILELEQKLKILHDNYKILEIYSPIVDLKTQKFKRTSEKKSIMDELPEEKVDVTYETDQVQQSFEISDNKVTDRWSRYIGAMGIESVKMQSKAIVAIIGIGSTGLELAKNIVLSGVKKLVLADWITISQNDLQNFYYADESQIGINCAVAVLSKLKQLNCYVRIEAEDISSNTNTDFIGEVDFVVICRIYPPLTDPILKRARQLKKKIVIAESYGVFGRIFCDFGDSFIVKDRDGEEPAECFIKQFDYELNEIVLYEKSFHELRVGDYIHITEVKSTNDKNLTPLNGSVLQIKNFRKQNLIEIVEDLKSFELFLGDGKVRELKKPVELHFESFTEDSSNKIDPSLSFIDFLKDDSSMKISYCFRFKETFERIFVKPVYLCNQKEFKKHSEWFFEHIKKSAESDCLFDSDNSEKAQFSESFSKLLFNFTILSEDCLHSVSAFIGGMAAQEVITGITGKFTPINQSFHFDCLEVCSEELQTLTEERFFELLGSFNEMVKADRQFYLRSRFGETLFETIKKAKLFIVGAGAIGCELLKNISQLRISSDGGIITLTDPDSIELSNLSRQFLYREKHISKPKALVAARVIESLNRDYKEGTIQPKLLKVCPITEDTFNDNFISDQSICLNALDNISARLYMDQRCVRNRVPLIESGTLGPKGHIQVIIPFVTESYAQVQDPQEENSIPICTLKMFPEESIHCIEWAKSKFEEFFSETPKKINFVFDELSRNQNLCAVSPQILKKVFKKLINRPRNCLDCVKKARHWFQKYFKNDILQLLSVYPEDAQYKDGKPFWSLPRRRPSPIEFDFENKLHMDSITSAAKLLMKIWSIDSSGLEFLNLKKVFSKITFKPFVSNESAKKSILSSVEKAESPGLALEENNVETEKPTEELLESLKKMLTPDFIASISKILFEENFEKDNDENQHVNFITAFTNLRAVNYSIQQTDWITVKLKAGKIIPALATTTATIAALQTIETIKILKKSQSRTAQECLHKFISPSTHAFRARTSPIKGTDPTIKSVHLGPLELRIFEPSK